MKNEAKPIFLILVLTFFNFRTTIRDIDKDVLDFSKASFLFINTYVCFERSNLLWHKKSLNSMEVLYLTTR